MVLNAAVQMLREAEELKQNLQKFNSGTSMLQDRNIWVTQQQLQKVYQKVLVLDLDYALDKKVEQDLWNIGFKQQIEALQSISRDRKNPSRSEGQAMLSWVLQAAAGFYLCLLHQICTNFKLDLPFRRRASLVGGVEAWGVRTSGATSAARYLAQHCLVHLGDLARYRMNLTQAHAFYRHALVVSAHCGQPYNQLALVAARRGWRLSALYWHARSLLVRAPFAPAAGNMARALSAARNNDGRSPPPPVTVASAPRPLDAKGHLNLLYRTMYLLYSLEELDTAAQLVNTLNSSLIALVATDSFEVNTLLKMSCVLIWLRTHLSSGESETEIASATLAAELSLGVPLACVLPSYTQDAPPANGMPALKVWLQWLTQHPDELTSARPHLWTALTVAGNQLVDHVYPDYVTVPLPEDEELHGFLPLEESLRGLRLSHTCSTDDDVENVTEDGEDDDSSPMERKQLQLANDPVLEKKIRAYRVVELIKKVADLCPNKITYSTESGRLVLTTNGVAPPPDELALLRAAPRPESEPEDEPETRPAVISEASFRERVREKRVGILKPQGSLERAREERALANIQENQDQDDSSSDSKTEESKREATRKQRMNVAMAAIMRKQEETNKQVKFVSPPPTPESTGESEANKPKFIQPKAIKSLANLPIGKKTGGILSLKDKSAGYPHLVNTEPEPSKKVEKEEKKEQKPSPPLQTHQNFNQKKEHPPSPSWNTPQLQPNVFNDQTRFNMQPKLYGQQSGLNFSPNYQTQINNQGIRLPVVNPKEIDVRSAALQKQSLRQDMYQDGHRFGNYQVSGDKKNFLNDLPPRFANQYRYWNQDNQEKRDDYQSSNMFGQSRPNWPNQQEFQQPPWWKQEPSFTPNLASSINMQPNYYSSLNVPYPNQSYQMPNQFAQKPESLSSSFLTVQPQMQVQNLVTSHNFNSSLNNFGNLVPTLSYDSAMYPQFNKGFQPNNKFLQKDPMDMSGLNFGSPIRDLSHPQMNMSFKNDVGKTVEPNKSGEGMAGPVSNTYSLFSGAPQDPTAWNPAHTQQSLWSGPGPSPLERLLEQQKQMKQASNEPQ